MKRRGRIAAKLCQNLSRFWIWDFIGAKELERKQQLAVAEEDSVSSLFHFKHGWLNAMCCVLVFWNFVQMIWVWEKWLLLLLDWFFNQWKTNSKLCLIWVCFNFVNYESWSSNAWGDDIGIDDVMNIVFKLMKRSKHLH